MSAEPAAVDPLSLPRETTIGGYLYVIRFSTGLIKVGCSRNPYVRMSNYRTTLNPFDITIRACWVSKPHPDHLANERELIRTAQQMSVDSRHSEYFIGVDFDELVAEVERRLPAITPDRPIAAPRRPPSDHMAEIRQLQLRDLEREALLTEARARYQERRDVRRVRA